MRAGDRLAFPIRLIAVLGLTTSALCAALLGSEILLRVFGPREVAYRIWRPGIGAEFTPDPVYVPGISGRARFTVNSHGFRGDELPIDTSTLRLLVVGGSTSEEVYLDDSETWPNLVQSHLDPRPGGRRVWVVSAGRSGMNARDNAVQVAKLLTQAPRFDVVIVLAGINDLTVALAQADDYRSPDPLSDPDAERRQLARAFQVVPGGLHETSVFAEDPVWKRTATWQLLRRTRARLSGGSKLALDDDGAGLERWREHRRNAPSMRQHLPSMRGPLADYRTHLEAIVSAAASQRVPVVLMTQPSLWRADLTPQEERRLWFGGIGDFQQNAGSTYYTVSALADAMAQFNRTLLDTCAARGITCLDLAARVPKDTSQFLDDVHFTERGAGTVAAVVAAWLGPLVDARERR